MTARFVTRFTESLLADVRRLRIERGGALTQLLGFSFGLRERVVPGIRHCEGFVGQIVVAGDRCRPNTADRDDEPRIVVRDVACDIASISLSRDDTAEIASLDGAADRVGEFNFRCLESDARSQTESRTYWVRTGNRNAGAELQTFVNFMRMSGRLDDTNQEYDKKTKEKA